MPEKSRFRQKPVSRPAKLLKTPFYGKATRGPVAREAHLCNHGRMKALVLITKSAALFLGVIVILWFGYIWVADYGDGVASGKYEALADGQRTTLVLRPDHTFYQTRVSSGLSVKGHGTWSRIGEGGLVFSGDMLTLPRQRLMSDGDAYATLYKTAGIWPPFISLDSTTTAPIYRKSLFGL